MPLVVKSMIAKLASQPKQLFLLDAFGALLTAFLLAVVVAQFEEWFGMPQRIVYGLSVVACVYAVYSFSCFFFVLPKWKPYLKAVAIANTIYCCLTLGLMIYFHQNLTTLGVIYFLGEIVIIAGLIMIERQALLKT